MTGRVVVLGIDPGSIVTGFGVVEESGGAMRALAWTSVRTSSRAPLAERLSRIHAETARLIDIHGPDEVAVENVFQARNVRSALMLGHARGATLLAAAQAGLPIFEYAPREVKKSVVGTGSATKEQVAAMVGRLLGISGGEMEEDESDAVAVAICHLHKRRAGGPDAVAAESDAVAAESDAVAAESDAGAAKSDAVAAKSDAVAAKSDVTQE